MVDASFGNDEGFLGDVVYFIHFYLSLSSFFGGRSCRNCFKVFHQINRRTIGYGPEGKMLNVRSVKSVWTVKIVNFRL